MQVRFDPGSIRIKQVIHSNSVARRPATETKVKRCPLTAQVFLECVSLHCDGPCVFNIKRLPSILKLHFGYCYTFAPLLSRGALSPGRGSITISLLHIAALWTYHYYILLHMITLYYYIFSISLLHITTIRDITTITSYYYTIHYYIILHHYYSLLGNTLSLLNSKFWEKLLLDYFHHYIISITTKHNYYVLLPLLPLLIPPTWRC
jgi:hypothetical protein